MASINIGSLKFNWKGTYNGSTAYAVDDVTEYNGSSYICILASTGNLPTNTTYFQPMATKGTDGTDVGTTLTTQGDILYRDGSGLQRLGAGTSGQVLKTQGAGANPVWGTASSGKILQYSNTFLSGQYSNSSASFGDFSGLPEFSITPTATSSKILIMSVWSLACENWNVLRFLTKTGSGSYGAFLEPTGATGSQLAGHFSGAYTYGDGNTSQSVSCSLLHSPNTTSQVSYKLQGSSHNPNTIYINRTSSFNSSYEETGVRTSNIMLMELAG